MITGQVFITGGSGTLAKALLTVARREKWDAEFTLYSRSELSQSLMKKQFPEARYVLGDVRDYKQLEAAIAGHSIVAHFAAMKRLPDAEAQPHECWQTNVFGTENVVRACIAQRVERCVMTSTDKACSAISCYGASKLIGESIFKAAPHAPCIFTLVRYGNVVASRGSVIPIWREQAKAGKPLTLTDSSMTRFFMSPFDAVKLVEQALTVEPGQIVVGKMGALSIKELAGIIAPGFDTIEVGMRSIEKHDEDLCHPDEPVLDMGTHFLIAPNGRLGVSYSSDKTYRLSAEKFMQMLLDAEELE